MKSEDNLYKLFESNDIIRVLSGLHITGFCCLLFGFIALAIDQYFFVISFAIIAGVLLLTRGGLFGKKRLKNPKSFRIIDFGFGGLYSENFVNGREGFVTIGDSGNNVTLGGYDEYEIILGGFSEDGSNFVTIDGFLDELSLVCFLDPSKFGLKIEPLS